MVIFGSDNDLWLIRVDSTEIEHKQNKEMLTDGRTLRPGEKKIYLIAVDFSYNIK